MIIGLAFSKDRALQLDATLRSFFRHANDAADTQMVVLYRASSARHESQYVQLTRDYGDRVTFVRERAFRRQVLEILQTPMQGAGTRRHDKLVADLLGWNRRQLANSRDHVLFMVDDAIFVRPFRLSAAVRTLDANSGAVGLSLRLGTNTTRSYAFDGPQSLPEFRPLADGVLKFGWSGADGDFGYPLEISSSLYSLELIEVLIDRLAFGDPNTLESKMALEARHLARRWPTLLCYPLSVAFCTPHNRVQEVFENRTGGDEKYSTERLADVFDRGLRIDVRALDGFVPSACHQEVELAFV